jgi:hypothetical protein
MQQLTAWNAYYTLVGTAAATLTGLMFIVVTLIVQMRLGGSSDAFAAFNTPSIVHFCAALAVAVMLCAPWPLLWQPDLLLGLAGLAGMLYMGIVICRAGRQRSYRPVLEDQLWHLLFPLVAYSALAAAALVWIGNATPALFISGAAVLLLLFIGIHNAWDNVTYLTLNGSSLAQDGRDERRRADAGEQATPGATTQ